MNKWSKTRPIINPGPRCTQGKPGCFASVTPGYQEVQITEMVHLEFKITCKFLSPDVVFKIQCPVNEIPVGIGDPEIVNHQQVVYDWAISGPSGIYVIPWFFQLPNGQSVFKVVTSIVILP